MSHEQGALDLLLRARRNQLELGDEARLEIALSSSRELELLYRAGVEFDASASLLAGDQTRLDALVLGALAKLDSGLGTAELRAVRGIRPAQLRSARSVAVRYFAAGLACSLLLSVALASAWSYVEQRRAHAHSQQAVSALSEPKAPLLEKPRSSATPQPAESAVAPVPLPAAAEAASGRGSAPIGGVPAAEPKHPLLERTREQPSESQLFSRANELRRAGNVPGAIVLYRQLGELYPNSAEAGDAKVLLGNLLLSQGQAQSALEQFEGYGSGALALEALWGKAQALRSLGDLDEHRVLEQLVSGYPSSPYASAARKRLRELSP